MSFFFENPGLAHIGHKILTNLDFDTQLECRLVHRSMKYLLEAPILNQKEIKYWLNECIDLNLFSDNLQVVNKWKNFVKFIISNNKQSTLKFHLERKSRSRSIFGYLQSTPILFFIDDQEIVQFILDSTKSEYLVFNPSDEFDETALHKAAGDGFIETVKILKLYFDPQKPKRLSNLWMVHSVDKFSTTPIICAAYWGHLEVIKILLPDPNVPLVAENTGKNPIHFAAISGHSEIVRYFIENRKALKARDNSLGLTPLNYAVQNGHFECVKLICDKLYEDQIRSKSLFCLSVHHVPVPIKKTWREKCYRNCIIHVAVENEDFEMVKYLCKKVKNPILTNEYGDTPIHLAASVGHLEMVKFLTSFTSNPNVINASGKTPIDLAVQNSHQDVIEYLILKELQKSEMINMKKDVYFHKIS